jgi:hypothetical protein
VEYSVPRVDWPSKAETARMTAAGENGVAWVLPEKWSEEAVDEKGEKLSKR